MATAQSKARKKIVHQLDTPYSEVAWPSISQDDQDLILELLCSLLSPIGAHRRAHITPSKGKQAKKNKRKQGAEDRESAMDETKDIPPPPEILSYADVGFNSITRNLGTQSSGRTEEDASQAKDSAYSVVFVARGDQASTFNCHLPKMVGAASKGLSLDDRPRLVGFSRSCSDRLGECLGVPRVSSIGIKKQAPGARALLNAVNKVVDPIDIRWLETDMQPEFLATKIDSIETTVGTKRIKVS